MNIYTSISISDLRWKKFRECLAEHAVDEIELLSVLCYKAGRFVCQDVRYLKSIKYQKRGGSYRCRPVHFASADHEYMHGLRLSGKVSVSRLISLAIDLFIDQIMQKGINPVEIAHLRVIQNTYKQKTFFMRNLTFKITKNNDFEEYEMKIRMEKT